MSAPVKRYTVTFRLPTTEVEVFASSADDAAVKAWHILGLAGVKAFGYVATDDRNTGSHSTLSTNAAQMREAVPPLSETAA